MTKALVRQLLDALPQTQCTRCGYADCAAYAEAVTSGSAAINRCPPGGREGIARLATLTGQQATPIDPECGAEGPRRLAIIDEAACIGCTLCMQACPVDCIIGAPKSMHTVIEEDCSGCELCLPACPVDCISLVPSAAGSRTGWQAWTHEQADRARSQYTARKTRQARWASDHLARRAAHAQRPISDMAAHSHIGDSQLLERKRELAQAALARARAKRAGDLPR